MHCGSCRSWEGSLLPVSQSVHLMYINVHLMLCFLAQVLSSFQPLKREGLKPACCSPRPVKQRVGGCFAPCRFRFLPPGTQ